MAIKKAYRINVKNLVYAVMTADTTEATSYDEIKKLSEAMQVQLTPVLATGNLFGDGVKQSTISKITGITGVFDATKINAVDRAVICGHTYENGVLTMGKNDKAPYIAVGYEVEQDVQGTSEYVWLLKGKAQPYASTVQQSTDAINYSTDSLTVEFVSRESDGDFMKMGDSADDEFTSEMAAAWFAEVGGGTPEPETEE